MKTLELEIQDSVMDKFMDFVNSFKNSEIKVKNTHFENAKAEVAEQLELLKSGKMELISMEEFEREMEAELKSYENKVQ